MCAHLLHNTEPESPEMAARILELVPADRISCVCVACPPVLSRDQAADCRDYVTVLTLQHDIVARMSLANVEKLRLAVLDSGWWEHLSDSLQKNKYLQRVADTLKARVAGAIATAASAAHTPRPSTSHSRPFH